MKPLAVFLLVVCLALAGIVLAVQLIDPPKPVLLVGAAMPTQAPITDIPIIVCQRMIPIRRDKSRISHT